MNKIIYDSKKIFLGGSGGSSGPTSADKISIKINGGEISEAKNVQEAVQMMSDGFSELIKELPANLKKEDHITVNDIIDCINRILTAFRGE